MANVRVSASEIRDRLAPFIAGPNEQKKRDKVSLHNKYFTYPKYDQIYPEALRVCRRHLDIPFVEGIFECEFKSMSLIVEIGEYCVKKKQELDLYYRWTFGMASGIFFQGELYNHTLNVFLTKEKVFFLNSTVHNKIWEGDPSKDVLIEVWM